MGVVSIILLVSPRSAASLNVSENRPLVTPYLTPIAEEIVKSALYRVYGPIVSPCTIDTADDTSEGTGDGVGAPSFPSTFWVTVILTGSVTLARTWVGVSSVLMSSLERIVQLPLHSICHCSQSSEGFEP